ncbi:hypothetical protein AMEX_G25547 [Astyanax mexicanus]|uniref:Uncharacterized protein n=1 Tax=Astyanax mexicanus TaxID=7994 RepID=A0A8T2KW47_ASTMX|nr:hypothetical protein AMEX_G25547 [Astyanax mexicanus]
MGWRRLFGVYTLEAECDVPEDSSCCTSPFNPVNVMDSDVEDDGRQACDGEVLEPAPELQCQEARTTDLAPTLHQEPSSIQGDTTVHFLKMRGWLQFFCCCFPVRRTRRVADSSREAWA